MLVCVSWFNAWHPDIVSMFTLSTRSRAAVAALALGVFASAFVETPLVAARTGPQPVPASDSIATPPRAHHAPASLAPRRDPFDEPTPPAASMPTAAPSPAAHVPALPPIPAALAPLPPNAGAMNAPNSPLRVTAVVTGSRPYALVEEPDGSRVVEPGEMLAGSAIVSIDASGIRLADGSRFAVSHTAPTQPFPTGGHP